MPLHVKNHAISSNDITNVGVFDTKVNRDGLILHLDSMDIDSYPGNGTTWFDLSGFGHNATLFNMNSPSAGNTSGFDTTTRFMMFDRRFGSGDGVANNYVLVNNTDILDDALCQNGMSIDMWFRESGYVCTAFTKWDGSWELYYCSTMVFRTQGSGGNDGSSSIGTSPGTWRNIVATHDGINRRLFVNGSIVLNDTNIVTGQNTTGPVSIGAYNGGTYASFGAIPIYRLYNRALNAYEIAENFQATRGRFGI
jgi:hypothetical protein